MKTPMFLLEIVLAAGCLNLGAASSPYTLEAPPGQYTNDLPAPAVVVGSPAALHGYYVDTFLYLSTPDFSHSEEYGFGLGVAYQFNRTLAARASVTHAGLNIENNAVSAIGLRLESRLPWSALSPYGFVGSSFDLRSDQFHLLPGIGIELGVTKLMKGMSLFAEVGLDANLRGSSSYLAAAGVRVRF